MGENEDLLRDPNFQLLLLANIIAPLGTTFLSPVLDTLIQPFEVSPAEIGLMMSAFTAPPIIIIPIIGIVSDRYGRKPLLIGGIFLMGLGGTAIAFTTDYLTILGLRMVQGIGYAAIIPIVITSIGDLYTGVEETAAHGLRSTSVGLANAVLPIVAGLLVTIAWQYPFLIYILAFPIGIVVYLYLEEPEGDEGEESNVAEDDEDLLKSLAQILSLPGVRFMIIARSLVVVIWIAFLTYNSILVVRFMEGNPSHAGLLASTASLLTAVAAAQAGRLTDRFNGHFYPMILGNTTLGLGFIIILFSKSVYVSVFGAALLGGFGLLVTSIRSSITSNTPRRLRGSVVGIGEASGRLMYTVTPILMGVMITELSSHIGFRQSIQAIGLGVIVLASGGGIICTYMMHISPDISIKE